MPSIDVLPRARTRSTSQLSLPLYNTDSAALPRPSPLSAPVSMAAASATAALPGATGMGASGSPPCRRPGGRCSVGPRHGHVQRQADHPPKASSTSCAPTTCTSWTRRRRRASAYRTLAAPARSSKRAHLRCLPQVRPRYRDSRGGGAHRPIHVIMTFS